MHLDRVAARDIGRGSILRLMSHIKRLGSKFSIDALLSTQLPPNADRLDNRLQIPAGLVTILKHAGLAWQWECGYHPRGLEILQPLRQQGGRHARHATAQLIETGRAGDELAKDDQSPPARQEFLAAIATGQN